MKFNKGRDAFKATPSKNWLAKSREFEKFFLSTEE